MAGIPDNWAETGYPSYPLFNAMVAKVLAEKKVPERSPCLPTYWRGARASCPRL